MTITQAQVDKYNSWIGPDRILLVDSFESKHDLIKQLIVAGKQFNQYTMIIGVRPDWWPHGCDNLFYGIPVQLSEPEDPILGERKPGSMSRESYHQAVKILAYCEAHGLGANAVDVALSVFLQARHRAGE